MIYEENLNNINITTPIYAWITVLDSTVIWSLWEENSKLCLYTIFDSREKAEVETFIVSYALFLYQYIDPLIGWALHWIKHCLSRTAYLDCGGLGVMWWAKWAVMYCEGHQWRYSFNANWLATVEMSVFEENVIRKIGLLELMAVFDWNYIWQMLWFRQKKLYSTCMHFKL